ncbi:MAG: glycosyltransferase family 2 protein [Planctomycetales bacterium]
MPKPTLSVLIPNYNHGRYISDNLDAILGQSHPPDEVIIVDDGSTDDSMSVINHYAQQDSRIRVYRNERNMGVVYTLNRALHLAKGDYCYGGAADDRVRPGFFEKAMNLLKMYPEAGLCYGYGSEFDSETGRVSEYPIRLTDAPRYLPPDELAKALARISVPGHSVTVPGNSTLWKRTEFLRTGGYREELRWHSDWFALQVVALRNGACFIPESLVYTRMERTSYSQAGQRLWDQQSEVLDRLLLLVKSEEFRDVLPRFQAGNLFSQFAPWIIRLIVSRAEHWDRDSALLIQNSLLAAHKTFLSHANPLLRQGTAVCLGELGPSAKGTVPALCRLLNDQAEVCTAASLALVLIQGRLPGLYQVWQNHMRAGLQKGWDKATTPLLNVAAKVYRALNYKLYGRIDRLEACLAQMLMENRDQQKKLFVEVQALQRLVKEYERKAEAAPQDEADAVPSVADAA